MGERRNLKKQSLEKLQQNLEQTEHQIEVKERRLNLAKQQMKMAKRKARNHSLIVRGAEVEKAFPKVKVLTEEEFRAFLKCIAHMKSASLSPIQTIHSIHCVNHVHTAL